MDEITIYNTCYYYGVKNQSVAIVWCLVLGKAENQVPNSKIIVIGRLPCQARKVISNEVRNLQVRSRHFERSEKPSEKSNNFIGQQLLLNIDYSGLFT